MTTKSQLQSKIQELEAELQSFKQQLNNYPEVTLETAKVGDTLADGSIVLQKSDGLTLLVAPKSTEVTCSWSPDFPEVFTKLKEQGFNSSQWFVPTKEQLQLAYERIKDEFDYAGYWSSSEYNSRRAWSVLYGDEYYCGKANILYVRTFRCVTY